MIQVAQSHPKCLICRHLALVRHTKTYINVNYSSVYEIVVKWTRVFAGSNYLFFFGIFKHIFLWIDVMMKYQNIKTITKLSRKYMSTYYLLPMETQYCIRADEKIILPSPFNTFLQVYDNSNSENPKKIIVCTLRSTCKFDFLW